MPDPTDETTPATPAPEPVAPPEPTFDFTGEFDADRARRLIEAQKADKARLRAEADAIRAERDELAAKWQAHEDAQLSEAQRTAKELADARAALAVARRQAALARHHLPDDALVFLTAESEEDIEAQATRLAALTPPSTDPTPTPDLHRTPQPLLVPGSTIPDPPEAFDPRVIAKRARERTY